MAENREKVSLEMLEKAKTEGVVQQKPSGKWGVISIQAGEWWLADYDTKEAADAALKAYHAQRKEFDSLSRIKSQLFDAPSEIKSAFNDIVEYFAYGYNSTSYRSDSYNDSDPRMESFFSMENQFLRLSESQMYSLFSAIQNGEYTPSNASKIVVLMALQAAAEGANTHRLVTRISNSSRGNYWPEWLVGGRDHSSMRRILNLRQQYKNSEFILEPDWRRFLNNPPYDMMAADYPEDYGNKGYSSDSYRSDSYNSD